MKKKITRLTPGSFIYAQVNQMKHRGNKINWGYPCLFLFKAGLHVHVLRKH